MEISLHFQIQMHHQPIINSPSSFPAQQIKLLVSKGSFLEALSLFKQHHHLHPPNSLLTPPLLPSLLKASPLPFALQLHSFLLKSNLISHTPTLNSLLSSYSNHSLLDAAHNVFDAMPLRLRDPITWASMINSYAQHGYFHESINTFKQMCLVGLEPKPELVAAVVSACGRTGDLSLGRAIHALAVVRSILDDRLLLGTSLIDMYSRCGDLDSGLRLFDSMLDRNVVTWTAMINGCVAIGSYDVAVELVRRMGVEGVQPNRATVLAVLPACGELGALKLGKEIHGLVFRHGLELEPPVVGSLINMYSKCSEAAKLASVVFEEAKEKDTVTWSSMIAAISQAGDSIGAFKLFRRMKRDGPRPNPVTMLAVIDACIGLASVDQGRAVLDGIMKCGFLSDVAVGNSLVNMFAKCGSIESSSRVFFELMTARDSVSYSTMIQSYGIHGCGHGALRLFEEMRELGFERDGLTVLAVLSACNHSGLIEEGKQIFESMKRDCEDGPSIEHYACFVDLLGRGGRIEEACKVVREMPMRPSAKFFSSLASACRVHGKLEMAEKLAAELIDSEPANAANHSLLSMVYAEGRNWEGVEDIRRVMRGRRMRKNFARSRI